MLNAQKIYDAFSGARRPSASEIPDIENGGGDLERQEIRDLLAPHAAPEVPADALSKYPLYTSLVFLSAASYRYYMPRFIEYCIENPGSTLSGSLIWNLGRSDDDRIAKFSPDERAIIRAYIEHCAAQPDAHLDADSIIEARRLWK